jgi:PKD repeat protein
MLRTSPLAAAALLFSVAALAACGDDGLNQLGNNPPVADAGSDLVVEEGKPVALDASASEDPEGDALSFSWDFGDGELRDGVTATWVFENTGVFTVTLTVTDEWGASDTDTLEVTVVAANEAPVANIVAPATAEVDELLSFDGSGSTDDVAIASWTWDMGDGTVLSGAEVEHAYEGAGTFTVVLLVLDEHGLEGRAEHAVEVTETVIEPTTLSGSWTWTLVDESQRDLGFTCGTFYDSTLVVDADAAPQITITEQASIVSNTYSGSLDGMDFDVAYESLGVAQGIRGTFTSPTSFEGIYSVSPYGQSCDERAVVGTKM